MIFEQACRVVIQRLQALDRIRREAERPFWLQALRREFSGILGGLYRPDTLGHAVAADATAQTCTPPSDTTDLTQIRPGTSIGPESPEVVDRSDTFPDDTQRPLDAWNAKVDAMLEETRRWQAGVGDSIPCPCCTKSFLTITGMAEHGCHMGDSGAFWAGVIACPDTTTHRCGPLTQGLSEVADAALFAQASPSLLPDTR